MINAYLKDIYKQNSWQDTGWEPVLHSEWVRNTTTPGCSRARNTTTPGCSRARNTTTLGCSKGYHYYKD
jgi:hypothetical protein